MTDMLPIPSSQASNWRALWTQSKSLAGFPRTLEAGGDMFGRKQKRRLAEREEELRVARGELARRVVELDQANHVIREMVKNALEIVHKANRRASPPA